MTLLVDIPHQGFTSDKPKFPFQFGTIIYMIGLSLIFTSSIEIWLDQVLFPQLLQDFWRKFNLTPELSAQLLTQQGTLVVNVGYCLKIIVIFPYKVMDLHSVALNIF